MSLTALLLIAAGALAGGFVSGLAGFGTGLAALGIWLHAVPPAHAASLVVICSVIAQAQTIRAVWHAVEARRDGPMVLAGLLGVPVGIALLGRLDGGSFRLATGLLLLAFPAWMLLAGGRAGIAWGGRAADAAVGFCGGVLGGFAGLSGPLPTMWATLRGWGRDRRRGLFQTFNLTVLGGALLAHAAVGLLTAELGLLALCALPGTLAGSWLGFRAYRRLSDRRFDYLVLFLLALSGLVLVRGSLGGG
ncbi:MAG TPA: sulfite exporter TauE/SafE family protein [Crenalkalicoccus sp.]|nr:sulfite exporter TauE/SafE family protein [Crenalkalicoccus sp.]